MEMKTKYNVGDTLYTVNKDTMKVYSGKVTLVMAAKDETKEYVQYNVKLKDGTTRLLDEEWCFASEVELKNYMFS